MSGSGATWFCVPVRTQTGHGTTAAPTRLLTGPRPREPTQFAMSGTQATAREMGADRMVIIDSDGQHDPEEIPQHLLPRDRGVDMVIGSRFCSGNGPETPAYRKVGMKVLNITTNFLGGLCVTDTQRGFLAFSGQAKGV